MFNNCQKEFAEYAQEAVNEMTSLYLPESDVLVEPVAVENAPKISMCRNTRLNVCTIRLGCVCLILSRRL